MNANQEAKEYISKLNELKAQSYRILLNRLKELGATPDKPIKFNWENQEAPCVITIYFEDNITDAYIKSIYADSNNIYISLGSYYIQDYADNVLLTDACIDYDTIIDYLIDWSWENNYKENLFMKTYDVNVHYDFCARVTVNAKNEEEAINKAKEIANETSQDKLKYCDFIGACIVK